MVTNRTMNCAESKTLCETNMFCDFVSSQFISGADVKTILQKSAFYASPEWTYSILIKNILRIFTKTPRCRNFPHS